MEIKGYQSLEEYKMDFSWLSKKILLDASKGELIPISLLRKYDVSTDILLATLNLLIHEGKLSLESNNKLKITQDGLKSLEQEEKKQCDEKRNAKRRTRKRKSKRLTINEPYLPIIKSRTINNEDGNKY